MANEVEFYQEPLDKLIVGTYPPADVFAVELAPGQGELERGSLLVKADAGYTIIASSSGTANGQPNAVLAEKTDTGADASGAKVVAEAYRSGKFNESALITKDGYELTDDDKEELRKLDIYVSGAY